MHQQGRQNRIFQHLDRTIIVNKKHPDNRVELVTAIDKGNENFGIFSQIPFYCLKLTRADTQLHVNGTAHTSTHSTQPCDTSYPIATTRDHLTVCPALRKVTESSTSYTFYRATLLPTFEPLHTRTTHFLSLPLISVYYQRDESNSVQ